MMLKRVMGKASFCTLQDSSLGSTGGRIPIYVKGEDVGDELGWQEVCNRRRPQRSLPPAPPLSVEETRAVAFRRRVRGRFFRCLASVHRVADCHGKIRCLSCRRSGHRERDC